MPHETLCLLSVKVCAFREWQFVSFSGRTPTLSSSNHSYLGRYQAATVDICVWKQQGGAIKHCSCRI